MEIFRPSMHQAETKVPAIIFFFGGGWTRGAIIQFEPHARYFSQRGITCILVDYRERDDFLQSLGYLEKEPIGDIV
jgi:acetyl esterase